MGLSLGFSGIPPSYPGIPVWTVPSRRYGFG